MAVRALSTEQDNTLCLPGDCEGGGGGGGGVSVVRCVKQIYLSDTVPDGVEELSDLYEATKVQHQLPQLPRPCGRSHKKWNGIYGVWNEDTKDHTHSPPTHRVS